MSESIIITPSKKTFFVFICLLLLLYFCQSPFVLLLVIVTGYFGAYELVGSDKVAIRDGVLRFSGVNTQLSLSSHPVITGWAIQRVFIQVAGKRRLVADSWRYSRKDVQRIMALLSESTENR